MRWNLRSGRHALPVLAPIAAELEPPPEKPQAVLVDKTRTYDVEAQINSKRQRQLRTPLTCVTPYVSLDGVSQAGRTSTKAWQSM